MPATADSKPSADEEHCISQLTKPQLQNFHKDGYLIIPNALSPSTISALLAETHSLLANFPLETHPMTKFSTGDSSSHSSHVGDDYFLTSGDKIRFFFEEDAFSSTLITSSPQPQHGNGSHSSLLTKPKHLAINKIGHYLHALSPRFNTATFTPLHADIASKLGFKDPRVLQSMVICKQPEIGGAVPPHQDSTFLYTNPPSAVGFWIALEDATKENGCLSFAKGSHRTEPVRRRFVRNVNGNEENEGGGGEGGTTFVDVEGARFPGGERSEGVNGYKEEGKDGKEEEEQKYELGPVSAGTLVLIHGNLLHKSEKNLSSKSRFIYTFHVIEGEAEYDGRNWLQPPAVGFSKLFP